LQDEKIQDAEKNQGESELRDALLAKSEYLTKIGQKEEAIESIR
jgi:26S proteasome regulatory subunit N7